MTTYGRPGWAKRALDAGVREFVVKDVPVDRLAEGIGRVMAGLPVFDSEHCRRIDFHGLSPLTERETDAHRVPR